MAITEVVAGTPSVKVSRNPSTTPEIPSGSGSTDLLIIVDVVVANTANQPNTPSGWTLKDSFVATGTRQVRMTWFYRTWDSGVTSPTVSVSGANGTQHRSVMLRVRGAKLSGDPTDVLGAQSMPPGSTSIMGPVSGVTTGVADGCVLVAAARENDLSDDTSIGSLSQSGLTFTNVDAFGPVWDEDMAGVVAATLTSSPVTVTDKSWAITAPSPDRSIGQMWSLAPEATGPVSTPVAATDAGSLGESVAVDRSILRTDSGSLVDSVAVTGQTAQTSADAGTLVDATVVSRASGVADTGSLVDAVALTRHTSLSDAATTSDTLAGSASASLSDVLLSNDGTVSSRASGSSDTGSLVDLVAVVAASGFAATDAGSLVESRTLARTSSVADSGSLSDVVARTDVTAFGRTDSGSLSESVTLTDVTALPVADSGSLVDSATGTAVVEPIEDYAALAESVSGSSVMAAGDSATLVESVAVSTDTTKSTNDTVSVSSAAAVDSVTVVGDSGSLFDEVDAHRASDTVETVQVSDATVLVGSLTESDYSILVESVSVTDFTYLSSDDTATIVERVDVSTDSANSVSDVVSLSDVASVDALSDASDSGSLSESVAVSSDGGYDASDTVSLVDDVKVIGESTTSDVGDLVEVVAIKATFAASDSGSLSESVTVESVDSSTLDAGDRFALVESVAIASVLPVRYPLTAGGERAVGDRAVLVRHAISSERVADEPYGVRIARRQYGSEIAEVGGISSWQV